MKLLIVINDGTSSTINRRYLCTFLIRSAQKLNPHKNAARLFLTWTSIKVEMEGKDNCRKYTFPSIISKYIMSINILGAEVVARGFTPASC